MYTVHTSCMSSMNFDELKDVFTTEFGKRWFRDPTLRRALFSIPESWPLWKTLTAGNALATLLKMPADLAFQWCKDNCEGILEDFIDWIQSLDPVR